MADLDQKSNYSSNLDDLDSAADDQQQKKKSVLQKLRERDVPGLKQDFDDYLQKSVVDPISNEGAASGHSELGENLGAGLGAVTSTVADYLVPNTPGEAAMSAVPFIGKLGKTVGTGVREAEAGEGILSKLANKMPSREASLVADEAEQGAAKLPVRSNPSAGTSIDYSKAGNTASMTGGRSTPGLRELQEQYQELASARDPKAQEVLKQIQDLRNPKNTPNPWDFLNNNK